MAAVDRRTVQAPVALPGEVPRRLTLGVATALGSVALGALVAFQPLLGVALLGMGLVLALAFLAPVGHLVLLVFLTAIMPFGIQNQFAFGGGAEAPGLLLSDALLVTGLLRAGLVVLHQPLDRRRLLGAALVTVFLAGAIVQFLHGVTEGRDASTVGYELRVLLGFGTFLVAFPILADARSRDRLLKSLLVLGVVLGVWGIAQWMLGLEESAAGDVGVREGVRFTSSGRGQVQGGLYGFPVAVVIAFAVLVGAELRSLGVRLTLAAIVLLNTVAMLLTYERTFWVMTVVGLGFVAVRGGHLARLRSLVWAPVAAILLFLTLATLAPNELTAARERLLSIGQYENDDSVRERVTETGKVLDEIRGQPIVGSGLAATVFWGKPWADVPPESTEYAHNGSLWLAWKLGIPLALVLLTLLVLAVLWGPGARGDPLYRAVRNGCQGALLVLLLASVTHPAVNSLSITVVMGLLAAVSFTPAVGPLMGRRA